MRGLLVVAALAGCGDNERPPVTVLDAKLELAFEIESNTVAFERTFVKDVPVTFRIDVTGGTMTFPGPEQVPIFGDLFFSVADPAALGEGGLGGDLPGEQPYQLSNLFVPATVAYRWYELDSDCNPGCTKSSMFTATLADNTLGGTAPPEATVQLVFVATLTGWVIDGNSPRTDAPTIELAVQ
jgi:hypothetical protein